MMKSIERMLRVMISGHPGISDEVHGTEVEHMQWEHKMNANHHLDWTGPPRTPDRPRLTDSRATAPFFVDGAAREATDEELMRENVHTPAFLAAMRERTANARTTGALVELSTSAGYSSQTESAARIATAALIDAALSVYQRRFATAFVMCRPPTHHAVGNAGCCRHASPKNQPFGFCHLNGLSSAITAVRDYAASAAGGAASRPRVAIIDIDVHHGNANEDTWYSNGDVLHVNFNENGIWPGPEHGDPACVGLDGGIGANLNFPMPVGEGDAAYCYALLEHALPIIEEFQPEIIFVACGLDAMAGDPYAHMDVSATWYGWLAAELREREIAPVVWNLEGGYSPESCAEAAAWVLKGLTVETAEDMLQRIGLSLDHLSKDEISATETAYTYVRRRSPQTAAAAGAGGSAGAAAGGCEPDRVITVAGPDIEAREEIDLAREIQVQMIDRRKTKKHGLRSPKLRSPTPSRQSPPAEVVDNSPCWICGKKEWSRKASIQCIKCSSWVHCVCVGVKPKEAKKEGYNFVCKRCDQSEELLEAALGADFTVEDALEPKKAQTAKPSVRKIRGGSGGGGKKAAKSATATATAKAAPASAKAAPATAPVTVATSNGGGGGGVDAVEGAAATAEPKFGEEEEKVATGSVAEVANAAAIAAMAAAADATRTPAGRKSPATVLTIVDNRAGSAASCGVDGCDPVVVPTENQPTSASPADAKLLAAILRVKSDEARPRPTSAASIGSASSLTDMKVDGSAPFGLTALISPLSSAPPVHASSASADEGDGAGATVE